MCIQLILLFVVLFDPSNGFYLSPQSEPNFQKLQWTGSNGLDRRTPLESSESWLDSYLSKPKEESTKSPSILSVLALAASSVLAKLSEPNSSPAAPYSSWRSSVPSSYLYPINPPQSYLKTPVRKIYPEIYPPDFIEYIKRISIHQPPPTGRHLSTFVPENYFRMGSRNFVIDENRPVGRISPNRVKILPEVSYSNSYGYTPLVSEVYSDIMNTKDFEYPDYNPMSLNSAPVILRPPSTVEQPIMFVSNTRQGEDVGSAISWPSLTTPIKPGFHSQQNQDYSTLFGSSPVPNERLIDPFITNIGEHSAFIGPPQEIPRIITHLPGFSPQLQEAIGSNPYIFGHSSLIQGGQGLLGRSPTANLVTTSIIDSNAERFTTSPTEPTPGAENTTKSSTILSQLQTTTPGLKQTPDTELNLKTSATN